MKYTSLMISILMLFLLLSFSASAYDNEVIILPGENTLLKMEEGKTTEVVFIPSVSGEYVFTSLSECDTIAKLYDENNKELCFDDDGGDTSNFYILYNFENGKRYIFSVWYYGDKINYDMPVSLQLIRTDEGHTHSYSETVLISPSCIEEGKSVFRCECGYNYTKTYERSEHNYEVTLYIKADCTKDGKIVETCSFCSVNRESTISALGHIFSYEFTVDTEPTCTSYGYTSRHCIRCNKSTDGKTLPKAEHLPDNSYEIIKSPTCTAKGEKVKRCSVCNKTLETVTTEKTEHIPTEYIITKSPTCTAKGEKVKRCSVCNKALETVTTEKTEHIPTEYIITKSPTCTAKGEKVKRCSVCNKTLETVTTEKTEHIPTEYIITKSPTCTAKGEKVKRCSVCNKTLAETAVEKLDHTPSDVFEVIKVPSCTADGEKIKRCTVCNKILESEKIDKHGHKEPEKYDTVKEATCTAKGEIIKRCTVCAVTLERKTTDKLGHSYSTVYTTDKKASVETPGSKSRHCIRCNSKTDVFTVAKIKSVKLISSVFIYDGKNKSLNIKVQNSKGVVLKNKKDYTVKYKKHKKIGSYKAVVTFCGDYEGRHSLSYVIIPQNVSDVKAASSAKSVKLKWSKVKGGVKYRVYRKIVKTGKYKLIKETEKREIDITKLKSGTEYTFVIKAVKKVSGKTYKSEKGRSITVSTVPAKVKLKGQSKESRSLKLTWNKTACDGYEIYKYNENNKKYELFKTIKKVDINNYERRNMKSGKTYTFKIRSYKYNGEEKLYSSFSKAVKVRVT